MLKPDAPVRFRGDQFELVRRRLRARYHCALIGPPGSGKTMAAQMALLDYIGTDPSSLTREEFVARYLQAIRDEEFYVLTGRSTTEPEDFVGNFVKSALVRCGDCGWETQALEGRRVLACLDCASPNLQQEDMGLQFAYGSLLRAVDEGKPWFGNELSRMPARSQDVLIPVLSEGHLSVDAIGQTFIAKEGFVCIVDMNTEDHDVNVESFAWALGSRLRKIYFDTPSEQRLREILRDRTSGRNTAVLAAAVDVYKEIMAMHSNQELPRPMIVRGALEWLEDFSLEIAAGSTASEAFITGARTTWLHDVTGRSEQDRARVMAIVQKVASTLASTSSGVTSMDEEQIEVMIRFIRHTLGVGNFEKKSTMEMVAKYSLNSVADLWWLLEEVDVNDLQKLPGIGYHLSRRLMAALERTTTTDQVIFAEQRDSLPTYHPGQILADVTQSPWFLHSAHKLQDANLESWEDVLVAHQNGVLQTLPYPYNDKIHNWVDENLDVVQTFARWKVVI